jgi:hypothetical protein
LESLAARSVSDFVGSPIETALWRARTDRLTRSGAWRTADPVVNAVVDVVARVLVPPSSTGWMVSWSPLHPGVTFRPDITIGSGVIPDLEGVVIDLMAEDRLLTFVRSYAIDRFMERARGRFVFHTQLREGWGMGMMLVLRT